MASKSDRTVLDLFRLDGRRALVTGGHKGLGLAMATALAEAGADVAVASRSLDSCTRRRRIDRRCGPVARLPASESTSRRLADVEALAAKVEAEFGPIDILVNNAGVNVRGAIGELTEADWDSVIDTNLKGPFLCSRTFGPRMCERGWGRVINLGSILGVIGIAGRVPYASSKAGVVNMTRVLALEWAIARRDGERHLPGPVRHRHEPPAAERPGEVSRPSSRRFRWDAGASCTRSRARPCSWPRTPPPSSPAALLFVDGGWTAQ